jgi:3-phosphoshikimate 1-carboxyvinyltransferase
MLGALGHGRTEIVAVGAGEDNHSTAAVLRQLGVPIETREDGWVVDGVGPNGLESPSAPLDCGNSGTTMRLMTGILAGASIDATLIGDASLSRRPMARVAEPLRSLGASVRGEPLDGKEVPPLVIAAAEMKGGSWRQPIASAQVKSCVLLAGLCSGAPVHASEPTLSRDHTERMLAGAGISVTRGFDEAGFFAALDANAKDSMTSLSDSGSLCGSELLIEGVGLNPTRTGIIDVVRALGGSVGVANERLEGGEPVGDLLVKHEPLIKPRDLIEIGGDVIPRAIDELVVAGALAAHVEGATRIRDAKELRVKASDRVEETVRLLEGFGASAEGREDGYDVEGGSELKATTIDVGSDHRVAMSAAVMACAADGESTLESFDVAAVSYPSFVEELRRLGADVHAVS